MRVKNTNLKEISNFRKIYFWSFWDDFGKVKSDNSPIFSKNGSKWNPVFSIFAKMSFYALKMQLDGLLVAKAKYLIFSNIYPFFDENLKGR